MSDQKEGGARSRRGARKSSRSRKQDSAEDDDEQPTRPRGRNVDASKRAEHAEASDRTQPAGKYMNAAEQWINAHGQIIDEDSGEPLDEDALDEFNDQRRAELDEIAEANI